MWGSVSSMTWTPAGWDVVGLGDSDDDQEPKQDARSLSASAVLSDYADSGGASAGTFVALGGSATSGSTGAPDTHSLSVSVALGAVGTAVQIPPERGPSDRAPAPEVHVNQVPLELGVMGSRGHRDIHPDDRPLAHTTYAPMTLSYSATISRLWWQPYLPNCTLAQISSCPDVGFRFPEAEPQSTSEWVAHCLGVFRSCATGGSYYWGITENPLRRWEECHCLTYSRMHVVAVCLTSRQTGQIERELISRSRTGHLCNNVGAGGERASAGSPHFVYLCTSSGLLRRSRAGGGGRGGRGRTRMGSVMDDIAWFGGGNVDNYY